MENVTFNYIRENRKKTSLLGNFEGVEHNSKARIARNKIVNPINLNVCMLFHES
jgi:hypothetical protein